MSRTGEMLQLMGQLTKLVDQARVQVDVETSQARDAVLDRLRADLWPDLSTAISAAFKASFDGNEDDQRELRRIMELEHDARSLLLVDDDE